MGFRNYQVANAVSAASSFQSAPILLERYPWFAIQGVFTGSPVGSIKLQASNDVGDIANPIQNWIDVTGSVFAISGAGPVMWNVKKAHYRWVSITYTATSGTGTFSAQFNTNNEILA